MLTRRQLIASGGSLLLGGYAARGAAQEAEQLKINSKLYIAINADTGAIFAQRRAHDRVAIASITKVFTAYEAIQMAPLSTEITTTSDDLQDANASVMGFGPGETFTLEELLYGLMLPSGNDAAYAIARGLGHEDGDNADEAVQKFVDRMNQRVLDMGLVDTHLMRPDGWGVPNHYSSAGDVAAFTSYAIQNDFMLKLMGTKTYTTRSGYNLTNNNRMLGKAPSVIGGKTGYDWDSGWCLMQVAEREGTRMIAVTLDGIAPDDWYDDNVVLLDYGFEEQTALGDDEFTGEILAWTNPDPALFMQAGPAEASINGETVSGEPVAQVEEIEQADIPVHQDVPERVFTLPTVPRSSSLLTGIGATVLAGGMAASRWLSAGGDATAATLVPSVRAAAGSAKSMAASLPGVALLHRKSPTPPPLSWPSDPYDDIEDDVIDVEALDDLYYGSDAGDAGHHESDEGSGRANNA